MLYFVAADEVSRAFLFSSLLIETALRNHTAASVRSVLFKGNLIIHQIIQIDFVCSFVPAGCGD